MASGLLFAYIDPMSGSITVQLILAALVGTSLRFRHVLYNLAAFFGAKKVGNPIVEPIPAED